MKRLAATAVLATTLLPWGATAHALPNAGDGPTSLSASRAGAVNWNHAGRFVSHNATEKGPVDRTHYASTGNATPTFLNLGAGYPRTHGVTSIVWGDRPLRGI